jgi:hypothetical protein
MITCSICNTVNHHLAIVCSSCGGFLQNRIDNLDLFATSWKVIESPTKAFRTIAIAAHKNYVILLSCVAGIALTFFIFWLIKAGEYADSLLNVLVAGFVVGPLFGIVTVLLFSGIFLLFFKNSRCRIKFRNVFAVTAYALGPIVLSVIIFLPIEILTFGIYFFTSNPSPYFLKPVSYVVLIGFDGLCALWSIFLLFTGMKALLDLSWLKVIRMVLLSLLIIGGLFASLLQLLVSRY